MERTAVQLFVFRCGRLRPLQRHLDAIPPGDTIAEFQRLVELVASFEIEDERSRGDGRKPMDDQAPLGAEGSGHGQPLAIPLRRPGNDLRGFEALEGTACMGQVLQDLGRNTRGADFDDI